MIIKNAWGGPIDYNIAHLLNCLAFRQLLSFKKTSGFSENSRALMAHVYEFIFDLSSRTYKITSDIIMEILEKKMGTGANLTYVIRSIAYLDSRSQLRSVNEAMRLSKFIEKLAHFYSMELKESCRTELADSLSQLLSSLSQSPGLDPIVPKIEGSLKYIAVVSRKYFKKTSNATYLKLELDALALVGDLNFLTSLLPATVYLAMIVQRPDQLDHDMVYRLVLLVCSYISKTDMADSCVYDVLSKIATVISDFATRGSKLRPSVYTLSSPILILLAISEKDMSSAVNITISLTFSLSSVAGSEKLPPYSCHASEKSVRISKNPTAADIISNVKYLSRSSKVRCENLLKALGRREKDAPPESLSKKNILGKSKARTYKHICADDCGCLYDTRSRITSLSNNNILLENPPSAKRPVRQHELNLHLIILRTILLYCANIHSGHADTVASKLKCRAFSSDSVGASFETEYLHDAESVRHDAEGARRDPLRENSPGSPAIGMSTHNSVAHWLFSRKFIECSRCLFRAIAINMLTHYCSLQENPAIPRSADDSSLTFINCTAHAEKAIKIIDTIAPGTRETLKILISHALASDRHDTCCDSTGAAVPDAACQECQASAVGHASKSGKKKNSSCDASCDCGLQISDTCSADKSDVLPVDKRGMLSLKERDISNHLIITALEYIPALNIYGENHADLYATLTAYSVSPIKQIRLSAWAAICRMLWLPICSPSLAMGYKSADSTSVYSLWKEIISAMVHNGIGIISEKIWSACPEKGACSCEAVLSALSAVLANAADEISRIMDRYKTLAESDCRRASAANSALKFEESGDPDGLISALEEGALVLLASDTPKTREVAVKLLRSAVDIRKKIIGAIERPCSDTDTADNGPRLSAMPSSCARKNIRAVEALENLKLSEIVLSNPSALVLNEEHVIPSLCIGNERCFLLLSECEQYSGMTTDKLAASSSPALSKIWSRCLPFVFRHLAAAEVRALSGVLHLSRLLITIFSIRFPPSLDRSCDLKGSPASKLGFHLFCTEARPSAESACAHSDIEYYPSCTRFRSLIAMSVALLGYSRSESGNPAGDLPRRDPNYKLPPCCYIVSVNPESPSPKVVLRALFSALSYGNPVIDSAILTSICALDTKLHPLVSAELSKILSGSTVLLNHHTKLHKSRRGSDGGIAMPEYNDIVEGGICRMLHLLVHLSYFCRAECPSDEASPQTAEDCARALMNSIDACVSKNRRVSKTSLVFAQYASILCGHRTLPPDSSSQSDSGHPVSAKFRIEALPTLEKWLMFFLMADAGDLASENTASGTPGCAIPGYIKPPTTNLLELKGGKAKLAYLDAVFSTFEGPVYSSGKDECAGFTYSLFGWIDGALKCTDDRIVSMAERCLRNVLALNRNDPLLLRMLMSRFYKLDYDSLIAIRYFSIIIKLLSSGVDPERFLPTIIPLVIYYSSFPTLTMKLRIISIVDYLDLRRDAPGYPNNKTAHILGVGTDRLSESTQNPPCSTIPNSFSRYISLINSTRDFTELQKRFEMNSPPSSQKSSDLQSVLTQKLSGIFPDFRLHVLSYLMNIVINLLNTDTEEDTPLHKHRCIRISIERIFNSMIPWLRGIELFTFFSREAASDTFGVYTHVGHKSLYAGFPPSLHSTILLDNLFYVTILFSGKYKEHLSRLWKILISGKDTSHCVRGSKPKNGNIHTLLGYLANIVLTSKSRSAFECSKFIVGCMYDSGYKEQLSKHLTGYITPYKSVALSGEDADPGGSPQGNSDENAAPRALGAEKGEKSHLGNTGLFRSNLDELIKGPLECGIESPCELSLLYMNESCPSAYFHKAEEFSSIIHAAHVYVIVSGPARRGYFMYFVSRTIREALPNDSKNYSACSTMMEIERVISSVLKSTLDKGNAPADSGGCQYSILEPLVKQSLSLFMHSAPALKSEWGLTALQWGLECSRSDMSSASFKILRTISPDVSDGMARAIKEYSAKLKHLDDPGGTLRMLDVYDIVRSFLKDGLYFSSGAISAVLDLICLCMKSSSTNVICCNIDLMLEIIYYVDRKNDSSYHKIFEEFSAATCIQELIDIVINGLFNVKTHSISLELLNAIALSDHKICKITDALCIFVVFANMPSFICDIHGRPRRPDCSNETRGNSKRIYGTPKTVARLVTNKLLKNGDSTALGALLLSYSGDSLVNRAEFVSDVIKGLGVLFFPAYIETALTYLLYIISSPHKKDIAIYLSILKIMLKFNKPYLHSNALKVNKLVKTLLPLSSSGHSKIVLEIIDDVIGCRIPASAIVSDPDHEYAASTTITSRFSGCYPHAHFACWPSADITYLSSGNFRPECAQYYPHRELNYLEDSHYQDEYMAGGDRPAARPRSSDNLSDPDTRMRHSCNTHPPKKTCDHCSTATYSDQSCRCKTYNIIEMSERYPADGGAQRDFLCADTNVFDYGSRAKHKITDDASFSPTSTHKPDNIAFSDALQMVRSTLDGDTSVIKSLDKLDVFFRKHTRINPYHDNSCSLCSSSSDDTALM